MYFTDQALEELLDSSLTYAGIGSRRIPHAISIMIERMAEELALRGKHLRSGAAPGADMAFEWGAVRGHGQREIFLPWKQFNGHPSPLFTPPARAEKIAALCHPNWPVCNAMARRLHARNCQQVAGQNLDDPVDFVLFWAPERDGVVQGGTATAITFARRLHIPTFNLSDERTRAQWLKLLAGDGLEWLFLPSE